MFNFSGVSKYYPLLCNLIYFPGYIAQVTEVSYFYANNLRVCKHWCKHVTFSKFLTGFYEKNNVFANNEIYSFNLLSTSGTIIIINEALRSEHFIVEGLDHICSTNVLRKFLRCRFRFLENSTMWALCKKLMKWFSRCIFMTYTSSTLWLKITH